MQDETESELIARCLAGSSSAFEPLVRRHEGRALAVAGALLGDADDAADAVQDAFVRAYRTLGRLTPGSAFGPWFRTILRNLCVDRLRAPRTRRRRPLEERSVDRRAWHDATGTLELERVELARRIREAMTKVSDEHREVLVLKEMEELGYDEIARLLGIPRGTVGSRLYHARAALQRVLVSDGVTLEDVP